jgi:preprotein translocase subunit SecE
MTGLDVSETLFLLAATVFVTCVVFVLGFAFLIIDCLINEKD